MDELISTVLLSSNYKCDQVLSIIHTKEPYKICVTACLTVSAVLKIKDGQRRGIPNKNFGHFTFSPFQYSNIK